MSVAQPSHAYQLAPYACDPRKSRGRLHKEKESPNRSPFQRDRDRIIHSVAFRRLEYKTQVFVNHEGDHYRTRLTHSLEVSQLARGICRQLRVDEDLGEAFALSHDLGHTPFGHAGEEALDEAMQPFGGFDHNAQTLRILTMLEQRYAAFDGLNLCWETLEGIAKHNGPLLVKGKNKNSLPRAIREYNKQHDLHLATYPSVEAQVASLADDIAYNNHDIDDGLRAGLFSIEDIIVVPMVGRAFQKVRKQYPNIDKGRLIHEAIRSIIHDMVVDLVDESTRRIKDAKVKSADDVRVLGMPIIGFSDKMCEHNRVLKAFLYERMYRHYRVNRMTSKARRLVRELFELLHNEPNCLPTEWQEKIDAPGSTRAAEVVADYIAGMTDRFALDEHSRLYDLRTRT